MNSIKNDVVNIPYYRTHSRVLGHVYNNIKG